MLRSSAMWFQVMSSQQVEWTEQWKRSSYTVSLGRMTCYWSCRGAQLSSEDLYLQVSRCSSQYLQRLQSMQGTMSLFPWVQRSRRPTVPKEYGMNIGGLGGGHKKELKWMLAHQCYAFSHSLWFVTLIPLGMGCFTMYTCRHSQERWEETVKTAEKLFWSITFVFLLEPLSFKCKTYSIDFSSN